MKTAVAPSEVDLGQEEQHRFESPNALSPRLKWPRHGLPLPIILEPRSSPVMGATANVGGPDWEGHSAIRFPDLNKTFPFMLPGWKAEKVGGGYVMISPRVAAESRRAGNGD